MTDIEYDQWNDYGQEEMMRRAMYEDEQENEMAKQMEAEVIKERIAYLELENIINEEKRKIKQKKVDPINLLDPSNVAKNINYFEDNELPGLINTSSPKKTYKGKSFSVSSPDPWVQYSDFKVYSEFIKNELHNDSMKQNLNNNQIVYYNTNNGNYVAMILDLNQTGYTIIYKDQNDNKKIKNVSFKDVQKRMDTFSGTEMFCKFKIIDINKSIPGQRAKKDMLNKAYVAEDCFIDVNDDGKELKFIFIRLENNKLIKFDQNEYEIIYPSLKGYNKPKDKSYQAMAPGVVCKVINDKRLSLKKGDRVVIKSIPEKRELNRSTIIKCTNKTGETISVYAKQLKIC